MDKSRKRSLTRVKSPVSRKPESGKSSSRSKSRSRGQQAIKDTKARGRPKSRTKKESRSRSRARVKSKSPAPITSSRSRRSVSRSRASSSGRKADDVLRHPQTEVKATDSNSVSGSNNYYFPMEVKLVVKDLYSDGYIKDPVYEDILRRSISREKSIENNYSVTRRYSSRLRETAEDKEPSGIIKESSPSVSAFKVPNITQKKNSYKFGVPTWIKAVVGLLFPPIFILLIHLACTKEQCTLSKFHIHRNINLYFNLQSAIIVAGFVLLQAILSLLSIGRRVGGPPGISGTLMYRCNGLLSTVITVGIVAGLWYWKYPVTTVCQRIMSMIVASTLIAYAFGVALFMKGGRASVPSLNPEAIGELRLYQFLIGREINPFFFGKINIKTLLLRVSLNGLVILNGLFLLRSYLTKHEWNYTLLTCVVLSTILVIDFFWFEDSFPSTFEAMYEGTGCSLTLKYMLHPFFSILLTKYIIHHKVEVPVYRLAAIIIVFVIGYFIYRASNLQKAAFRRNPLNPALAHFETISTSRGKKLLITSWWGFVRHPNYLGSIILYWAWASTAGYAHAIPYIYPLVMTLMLLYRARRVDAFCRMRYQSAWDEYCKRVPHRIIPRIY